jgi:MFS family permease
MSNMLAFSTLHQAAAGAGTRGRDVPLYLAARFLSEAAALAQTVAIGWTVYRLSNTAWALGIVGIVQFVPMLLLTLPAGELCDRLAPRRILTWGLAVQGVCAAAFMTLMLHGAQQVWPFYLVLLVLGAARAFTDPADQALLPFLVAPAQLPRAIAWSSSAWQVAVIAGPALGGLAYAWGPGAAFGLCALGFLIAMAAVAMLGGGRLAPRDAARLGQRLARIIEGIGFVRSQPLVRGAISLDLFAVLLGGSTALLPVYARDVLHVGPTGLGVLRSAPAVGACLVGLLQTRYPPQRRVGLQLLAAVAVFGVGTLVFALSRSFVLSLIALLVVGASDMVSVNIRSALVQLATPDPMRGRVSAVNMLFIGASSELGAFESGAAAALLGAVPAVALGGVGTLVVAALWMVLFPALRRCDRLDPEVP